MFISLPNVFEQMGVIGHFVGALFFVLVFFAALTSAISLMETIVSCLIDKFTMKRSVATAITLIGSLIVGVIVCLGYNLFYFTLTLLVCIPS